jgi:tetratricopeptide (TPR) repeat protein
MKTCFHLLLAAMAVWISAGPAAAAGIPAEFDAANKLYAEGKFADAAGAYEKMIQSGAVSPALYFNYGNAAFKTGNLGRAIAAYRRAEQLAPRDAEVRANLEFARNQVQGPTLRENRWADWLGTLSLNEWTGLAAAALWLMFALLMARQIRPALKPVLRGFTRVAVAAVITSGACAGVDAANHFTRQTVVVVAPDPTVRSGPVDEAQSAFTVHNGAELSVLDRRDNWLQVTDGSGRIGWLPSRQVELLPGS